MMAPEKRADSFMKYRLFQLVILMVILILHGLQIPIG